ncbi:ABATE domain-containing protein [Chelativorans sp. AA-79]|uniref:CGNR zinc finger domain-containing protein n=1 Tax=Chelativorans sp. AA-79 TaxID=3028735 RepID=UPI0023F745A7|nr:ABATE domain-containing protein [Chelativorans sp. AA-79]WEX09515.1 CGNR zinc finger domain-containing protein [Chelativorans sp. AA-79]
MNASLAAGGPVPFFFGGRLCLNFVNTVNSRTRPATRDYLPGFREVLGWSRQMRLFEPAALGRLAARAEAAPAEAAQAREAAIALREALYGIFRSVMDKASAPKPEMRLLNDWLHEANGRQVLAETDQGFSWTWDAMRIDLHLPACAVALSAADLLAREDLKRVKACPGPDGCGWLFYDETKNASRRWCSMEHCGGAAKARRYAARHGA